MSAATRLVQKLNGEVAGYAFVISLDFLNAREKLEVVSEKYYHIGFPVNNFRRSTILGVSPKYLNRKPFCSVLISIFQG